MRFHLIIIVIIIFNCKAIAQSDLADYLDIVSYLEEVNSENVIEKKEYINHDLSHIWTHENYGTLGFIGSNYRKLDHKFLSVIQDAGDPNIYYAYGKTMVSGIVREFQGVLRVKKIYSIKNSIEFDQESGMILGTYHLFESSLLDKTGRFQGRFVSFWYKNKEGKIVYNDLWYVAAEFNNNQFAGTWTSYQTSNQTVAKWGDSRILNSGDLDVGTSEFYPNPKYKEFGWDNIKIEDIAWWDKE